VRSPLQGKPAHNLLAEQADIIRFEKTDIITEGDFIHEVNIIARSKISPSSYLSLYL